MIFWGCCFAAFKNRFFFSCSNLLGCCHRDQVQVKGLFAGVNVRPAVDMLDKVMESNEREKKKKNVLQWCQL